MPEQFPKTTLPAHLSGRASSLGAVRRKEAGSATAHVLTAAGVVGVVVLGYHGKQFDVRQTQYASREDCLREWGSEESCSPAPTTTRSGGYVSPRYYWDPNRGRPVVIGTDGSERVATSAHMSPWGGGSVGRTSVVGSFARGGFGSIGRGFSAGRGG